MSLLLYTFKSENIHVWDNAVLMNWDQNLGLENLGNISMMMFSLLLFLCYNPRRASILLKVVVLE